MVVVDDVLLLTYDGHIVVGKKALVADIITDNNIATIYNDELPILLLTLIKYEIRGNPILKAAP